MLVVGDSFAFNWMDNILVQIWVGIVLDLREVSFQQFCLSSCVLSQCLLVLSVTALFVTMSALALICLLEHISNRVILIKTFPVLGS